MSINTNPSVHQLVVSSRTNETLANATNAELTSEGQTSVLTQSAFGRLISHITHLGGRTAFVTDENAKVVTAFTEALQRRSVSRNLTDYSVRQLQARANELSGQKTLLKFSDLQAVLQQQDAKAHEIILSYLPASSQQSGSVFDTGTDGEAFTALAQKHGIDTPELRQKFATSLEARIFAAANSPEMGPEGTMHFLADFAEEAAAGLRPGTYDKPLLTLFNEFPSGLSQPKALSDGPYLATGKPDHGAQTFIFFKRVSPDNIPYDAQGAIELRAAALSGAAAPDTPAARGDWTDVPQKFHFSVDKTALQEGKAWPMLHKLLSSEENPFLQWKIGNPLGLHAIQKDVISDLTKEFTVDGPTLTNSSGVKKRYSPIPVLENQVLEMTNQQKIREGMVESGSMTPEDFDRFQTQLTIKEGELKFVKGVFQEALQNEADDRCVDGAQFTLYTQHDSDKTWTPEEVQKYTGFLAKLENILTDAGVEPGKLPSSDVTIPGLRYATFRDEDVGDAAQKKDKTLNYQHPPAWLLDNYRDTPFYKLATEAMVNQVPANSVQV